MRFLFIPGLRREVFRNVRLIGGWDAGGRVVEGDTPWSVIPMSPLAWEDGGLAYEAHVELAGEQAHRTFRWGVLVDTGGARDAPAVITEIHDGAGGTPLLERRFVPAQSHGDERYHLSLARCLGSQKVLRTGAGDPLLRFSVWAPHAEAVEVVFGLPDRGYISDDGVGIDPGRPAVALGRWPDGVWRSDDGDPRLARFDAWIGVPYMFRVRKEGGAVAYRTDLYARAQIGTGRTNPHGARWDGGPDRLDGGVSCSLVVDPDVVARDFAAPWSAAAPVLPDEEFWRDELRHDRPVPQRLEDLVIYELHVGSLGFGAARAGNLADAMSLLDYLEDLGVNAVELLPIVEFAGDAGWGYGSSHHFAVEASAGGRDQLKHFVRECHRRGIAVIVDVVYNHFVHDAERAQWRYDSDRDDHNAYYWYQGTPEDYEDAEGGYVDNMSSGFSPRYSEEMVRGMFISSALAMIDDLHVDGFRVDQTSAIHGYNVLHADGRSLGEVNVAGARFLRELGRAVKLARPATFLIAEDHSNWSLVKELAEFVGLGFDAAWYADYYHHLIGDADRGSEFAKLLFVAGFGDDTPLRMDYFAGALAATGRGTIVYHESHDEAGNSPLTRRTLCVALALPGGTEPDEDVRRYGEERCRFVAAVTLFSAGTPMFLFGEEIGSVKPLLHDGFLAHREDLWGARERAGRRLFEFYRDAIRLRRRHAGLRSTEIEIVHVHNDARVIAFRRVHGPEEYLVVGSLANAPQEDYALEHRSIGSGVWREIFNTDAARYGGAGIHNPEAREATDGKLVLDLPPRGVIVLRRGVS